MQGWWESLSFIASARGVVQRACLKQDCSAYWLGIPDPHLLSDKLIRVYVGLVWQQHSVSRLEMEFSPWWSYFNFVGFGQVYPLPVEKYNHYILTCSDVVCVWKLLCIQVVKRQSNSYFLLPRLVLSWWNWFWCLRLCYVFCWLSILSVSTREKSSGTCPCSLSAIWLIMINKSHVRLFWSGLNSDSCSLPAVGGLVQPKKIHA